MPTSHIFECDKCHRTLSNFSQFGFPYPDFQLCNRCFRLWFWGHFEKSLLERIKYHWNEFKNSYKKI